VARWAPIPLRLIVGSHGYAKLVKDPDVFVGILHAIWHSRASWCHNVQSFCSWLSIRHRRYGGDLRSNQKDGRQCTEHLRRDRRSAAVKAVPAAGGVPYLHIIVERSTRYAAVVAAGLVLFGLLLPTAVTAQQRASVANDLSVSATALTGDFAEKSLGREHITCNKNGVPFDPEKPTVTSGVRLGTSVGTTRGFGVAEFREIGRMIAEVLDGLAANGPTGNAEIEAKVRAQAIRLCQRFPIYPT
jgi:glycine hydroxymethyltransferase